MCIRDRDERILILAERWPRNLMYTAERLPGMMLSPIILFALVLPFLAGHRGGPNGTDELPLLLFTVWPLLFYPLLQLEPRLLFPTLIGTCVFGAAGLLVLGRYIADSLPSQPKLATRVTPALVVLVLALLVPVTGAMAWNSEAKRGFHREVGEWLRENVPEGTAIAGDGYGYVSASTFWAGVKGEPRLWVDDPAALAPWARDKGFGVVLLFEDYVRGANPQLRITFDYGIPGMQRLQAFEFPRVGRVDVWALKPEG